MIVRSKTCYSEKVRNMETELIDKYITNLGLKNMRSTKLSGMITSYVFIQAIQEIFNDVGIKYKLSQPNSFIKGYSVEWDLLVLKEDFKECEEKLGIYNGEDVICAFEFKKRGLGIKNKEDININSNKNFRFKSTLNDIRKINKNFNFGYITYREVTYWNVTKILYSSFNSNKDNSAFRFTINNYKPVDDGIEFIDFVLDMINYKNQIYKY